MSVPTTVILGGGFGGISAANSLRQLLTAEHEIVVIDESSRFHVGAGKTWVMLGGCVRRGIWSNRRMQRHWAASSRQSAGYT